MLEMQQTWTLNWSKWDADQQQHKVKGPKAQQLWTEMLLPVGNISSFVGVPMLGQKFIWRVDNLPV